MQDSKHSLPVGRHPIQDVGAVVCSPDNTNMAGLCVGLDSLLINRDGGGSEVSFSLIISGLGVKAEQFCFGSNKLNLKLLAIHLNKVEEHYIMFLTFGAKTLPLDY